MADQRRIQATHIPVFIAADLQGFGWPRQFGDIIQDARIAALRGDQFTQFGQTRAVFERRICQFFCLFQD